MCVQCDTIPMNFTFNSGCSRSHNRMVSVLNYLFLTVWKNIPSPAQIQEQTGDELCTSL